MDFVEASNIDLQKESEHWWIKTRFQYLDLAIRELKSKEEISVLEVGCGTAQNLAYLRNNSPYKDRMKKLVGVDLNLPDGFHRADLGKEDLLLNNPDGVPKQKFDLLIMLDLIEHVDDPVGLINSYKSYLNEGGLLLILVPSFQSLWSQHDIALGHVKRYTQAILHKETQAAGFRAITEGYLFSIFFPVVYILRRFFRDNSSSESESDLKLPHPVVNALCYFIGVLERRLGNLLPFGTSAYGIYELDK